jgi:hypothetical protein
VLEAHYEVVAGWIDVATKMVLGVVGLAYVYRLMRRSR